MSEAICIKNLLEEKGLPNRCQCPKCSEEAQAKNETD